MTASGGRPHYLVGLGHAGTALPSLCGTGLHPHSPKEQGQRHLEVPSKAGANETWGNNGSFERKESQVPGLCPGDGGWGTPEARMARPGRVTTGCQQHRAQKAEARGLHVPHEESPSGAAGTGNGH